VRSLTKDTHKEGRVGNTSRRRVPSDIPKPNPDLKGLDKLVGTWRLSGEVTGRVKYEWAEGGFFLLEHVDMVTPLRYGGRRIKGIWLIGHERRVEGEPSSEIKSRFYSFLDGLTLDYVYEAKGDTLTIWFGDRGSDNLFRGKFSPDGDAYSGEWEWPGGGYRMAATRVK
jgi:hypothetical protein